GRTRLVLPCRARGRPPGRRCRGTGCASGSRRPPRLQGMPPATPTIGPGLPESSPPPRGCRVRPDRPAQTRRTPASSAPPCAYPGPMSELPAPVSETFDPRRWRTVAGFEDLTDITYHRGVDRSGEAERDLPVVRIAFDRPEVRNAFRPHTVDELFRVLDHARMTSD